MSSKEETSALEFLDSVIEDTPQAQRAARREKLRLELARYMKKAREAASMTQGEVAEALGVTQAWVSKLESPNHDHKLESILSYFDALGGEMRLTADVAEESFTIWGDADVWTIDLRHLGTSGLHHAAPIQHGRFDWPWDQQSKDETGDTQSAVVFDFETPAPRLSTDVRPPEATLQ